MINIHASASSGEGYIPSGRNPSIHSPYLMAQRNALIFRIRVPAAIQACLGRRERDQAKAELEVTKPKAAMVDTAFARRASGLVKPGDLARKGTAKPQGFGSLH